MKLARLWLTGLLCLQLAACAAWAGQQVSGNPSVTVHLASRDSQNDADESMSTIMDNPTDDDAAARPPDPGADSAVDEAIRLNRARASRSGHPRESKGKVGGTLIWRARVTGGMVGSLFLRALERSDRIYMAMVSRGYDGEVRTLPRNGLSLVDWTVLMFSLAVLSFLLLIAFLL